MATSYGHIHRMAEAVAEKVREVEGAEAVLRNLPYAFAGQSGEEEIKGCSPYGASTIAGPRGERMPGKTELEEARYQGRHVDSIAAKLTA